MIIASILDSWHLITSPSEKFELEIGINVIWESVNLSAINPAAPEFLPIIFSPIIKSEVFDVGLIIELRVIFGADGVLLSIDSKIPKILITSGTFKEINSSWILVPYG